MLSDNSVLSTSGCIENYGPMLEPYLVAWARDYAIFHPLCRLNYSADLLLALHKVLQPK